MHMAGHGQSDTAIPQDIRQLRILNQMGIVMILAVAVEYIVVSQENDCMIPVFFQHILYPLHCFR